MVWDFPGGRDWACTDSVVMFSLPAQGERGRREGAVPEEDGRDHRLARAAATISVLAFTAAVLDTIGRKVWRRSLN